MSDLPWEDNLLERKVESDLKDLLKTLVAFANSVKPGHTAVILIGERNDGSVEGVKNADNIQKKIREESEKIYPNILWRCIVYERESKYCIRIEIEYSGDTPHFGGPSWIRKGSSTIKAPNEIFQSLIDIRMDIVRELYGWINREVTVYGEEGAIPPPREIWVGPTEGSSKYLTHEFFRHRWPNSDTVAILLSVNRFWITLQRKDNGKKYSEPLRKLTLSFDNKLDQLKILIAY
jgi:hypothetical protein